MNRRIFWSVYKIFLRLPVYEVIAAIFWRSASYVEIKNFVENSVRLVYPCIYGDFIILDAV